jgi:DNA end-binding protein Ku
MSAVIGSWQRLEDAFKMANLKASIDFGLVHIPVQIINAEDKQDHVSFHMLDAKDNSRIRFKRVNENTGKEVEWEDIVKGYEVDENKYVVFSDEELDALEVESNKSLAIDAFVNKEEIPPSLFESPYYLLPEKGGEKGYALLERVLDKSKKYAIVQAVLRNKQRLGVIYANGGSLMLDIIRYPSELKKASEVVLANVKQVKISEREVSMAERLLKEMSAKFKPADYKDEYLSKLQEAIEYKMKSKKTYTPKQKAGNSSKKSIDIVDLLAKSLKGSSQKQTKTRKAA